MHFDLDGYVHNAVGRPAVPLSSSFTRAPSYLPRYLISILLEPSKYSRMLPCPVVQPAIFVSGTTRTRSFESFHDRHMLAMTPPSLAAATDADRSCGRCDAHTLSP